MSISSVRLCTDPCKSESEFLERLERDAASFTPLGTKIHSYSRRLGGKGKGHADLVREADTSVDETVEFEVYHVRLDLLCVLQHNQPFVST